MAAAGSEEEAAAAGGNGKQRRRLEMTREWTKWDVFAVVNCLPPHLLTLVAPFYFSWGAFWFAIVFANTTGLLGINLSYHRHLCHKSFKIPKWLEYFFAYLGLHALQGDPGYWVSTHRFHHQHSDTDRDPHSPAEGFWFSHLGWIFNSTSIKGKCGRRQNVGDLDNQAFYRWLHKTYFLHPISLGVLLYKYGGLPYLFWGMLFSGISCCSLSSLDVASELSCPYLGNPTLEHQRLVQKQLVGGDDDVWRGLAQQSPRFQ
ncbi:unnamed protein product [Linum tenue]|uniref:Fatty acid desaturase domain-containing protein n=1 Tax=Linum tenue TaxID=586396 RepID=A0AAV0HIU7_9ROSI|nr:unnamed protein product [Linum tenue]